MMVDENGNKLPYHEYLIQRGKMTQEKIQKQADEKNGKEKDGCTFKPKILAKSAKTQKESDIDKLNSEKNKELSATSKFE